MKSFIRCLIVLLLSAATSAWSEDLTAEKKKLIDEFLQLTRGDRMGELFAGYYIQEISTQVLQEHPDVDKRAFTVIEEEVNSVINDAVTNDNAINELSYPIYHKHLTSEDISELIRFYKSPIGQKTMKLLPTVSRETMQAGENWGRTLGPTIMERVRERFTQEAIITTP